MLEKNRGSNYFDIGCTKIFLDIFPEARKTKEKINYWDYIKIKSFCTVKETINKTKRQPTEWEKTFANDISDKGLASKIYKELYNPTKKWAEDMNKYFSKEDIIQPNTNAPSACVSASLSLSLCVS